jgi:hypothetical protein
MSLSHLTKSYFSEGLVETTNGIPIAMGFSHGNNPGYGVNHHFVAGKINYFNGHFP